jgi:acyl-CoA reductase-like NAD-dependent aldehyde dehydrogenase
MNTPTDWRTRTAALHKDSRPAIGGERVSALATANFETRHPHDDTQVATLPDCAEPDVDRAVAAARQAFESRAWSGLAPAERAERLCALADQVQAHADELALLDSLEMGMPIAQGSADLRDAAAGVRAAAHLAESIDERLLPSAPSTQALARRTPHGVVGAISPWNFPVYVALDKVVSALAMGNTVVLKPSEVASLGCLRLADLACDAGLPPGVLNVVPGRGETAGRALALHKDVDALSFTGSTATGQRLMAYAGQSNLKALMLECGGKSPQLVFDDLGDLDALAEALVQGFTWNSGQVCVAGTRILVVRPLLEPLWERLAQRVEALATGDPLEEDTRLGPLANRTQAERVRGWLDYARRDALRSVSGRADDGFCHVAPTLLRDLPHSHPLMQEEIFGPVAGVVPFDDETEALRLANDSRYGLSATVWTRDTAQARRLALRLQAGSVQVNATVSPSPSNVTGLGAEPVKMSGFGPEGGVGGLLAYTRLRSVVFNLG